MPVCAPSRELNVVGIPWRSSFYLVVGCYFLPEQALISHLVMVRRKAMRRNRGWCNLAAALFCITAQQGNEAQE